VVAGVDAPVHETSHRRARESAKADFVWLLQRIYSPGHAGNPMNPDPHHIPAESIRRALIDAAEAAYEDAGIQGLCAEGRWEAAVSAMRRVDVEAVARGAAGAVHIGRITSIHRPFRIFGIRRIWLMNKADGVIHINRILRLTPFARG
jgi:hypothetical protein